MKFNLYTCVFSSGWKMVSDRESEQALARSTTIQHSFHIFTGLMFYWVQIRRWQLLTNLRMTGIILALHRRYPKTARTYWIAVSTQTSINYFWCHVLQRSCHQHTAIHRLMIKLPYALSFKWQKNSAKSIKIWRVS